MKAESTPPSSNKAVSPTSPDTKPIKAKKTTPSPKKRKLDVESGGQDAAEGWTSEDRIKLFEAFQACSSVKWDDVAKIMGPNYTGKQCREQWQRATGKKIRRALEEA